ncbi:hypothetical protein A2U01_0078585, partial [Trifolium medium]|nr:hypothetical protein [Trifolium medium]
PRQIRSVKDQKHQPRILKAAAAKRRRQRFTPKHQQTTTRTPGCHRPEYYSNRGRAPQRWQRPTRRQPQTQFRTMTGGGKESKGEK